MSCCVWLLVCLAVCVTAGNSDNREVVDKKENLSEYSADGEVLYKTLWKLKDCAGPAQDGDDVTMIIKYDILMANGTHGQMEQTLTTKIGKGGTIRSGLYRMCLGEQRRLVIPQLAIHKYRDILPGILASYNTIIDVEMIIINKMSLHKSVSGLVMVMLEPVEDEFCSRTVIEGDTLYVEYEGTLEDGTVFDSSSRSGKPFGPFVHGRNQIIDGYTEALEGRCLGERWRMTVPPNLAYGDDGVGDDIPGGATLTFDVRLIKLNEDIWGEEIRNKKVLGYEVIEKPAVCDEFAGAGDDELYIHYEATREDKSKFGSLVTHTPPYGPFSLSGKGTFVPALDYALPGMCLGERRVVVVPPRMGWVGGHHDSIRVEVVLVKMNGKEADILNKYQKSSRGRRGDSGKIEL